ncbi:MAG TPA: TrkH family potassium uptake protein [Rubrobacteraceae bacterium]|nr:TrkH family potassium uptake protein [Rubrobacteraceae bacterium]
MERRFVPLVVSGMVLTLGLALLAPLTVSLLYADGSWESFLMPSVAMTAAGGLGFWLTRPSSERALGYVHPKDVLLSVTFAWILAALLGGAPFLLEGTFSSPIDSTFESMSGFTTTGATLLSEVEAQTPSILFWRSMTQWLGGIGIVVLFVGVAPVVGFGAARLLSAEVSGISQPRLTPRIADTAKVLLTVYLSLTIAQVVALLVAGMSLYDAVLHAFTTIATGGFNPRTASVGFYDSVAIEAVIVVFMALSGVSFALYYVVYTGRNVSRALRDPELLTYLGILLFATLLVWAVLVLEGDYANDWARAFRDSVFTVTSITTTTGFVTADFDQWDTMARITLVVLMFIGGCAGSTAGGVKVVRVIVVFKTVVADLFRGIHPRAVTPLKLGGRLLSEDARVAILGLVLAWFAIFAVATILVASQEDLTPLSSATAVAATLNVIGPGLGQVGASESYEVVNAFGRVVLSVCMLLGRLEILTALALLSPAFWKR